MEKRQNNTAWIGILFILATLAGSLAAAITPSAEIMADRLTQFAASPWQITVSAFLQFLMAVSCAGIGLAFWPVLRRYNEGWAISIAGFRLVEGVIQVLVGAGTVAMLSVSKSFVSAGSVHAPFFLALGSLIQSASNWLVDGPMLLAWCIGALMYYGIFFRYHLVPRWLSVWGLAGIVLTIMVSLASMLGFYPEPDGIRFAAFFPIALQEMVFAIWLIARGIKSTALA
jgi:hypothetical protein